MTVGEKVNRYREQAMLTQEELGKKAGVSGYTVSRIEGDHVEPRFSTVRKLARALGVEPAELWADQEEEDPKAEAPANTLSGQPETSIYLRMWRVYLFRLRKRWRENPPTSDEADMLAEILRTFNERGWFTEQEDPDSFAETVELESIRSFIETLSEIAESVELDREFQRILDASHWLPQEHA